MSARVEIYTRDYCGYCTRAKALLAAKGVQVIEYRAGDDPEKRAYVVGVDWKRTYDRANAKTYAGIFANQNIACKIYDEKTVDFLLSEFKVSQFEEGET